MRTRRDFLRALGAAGATAALAPRARAQGQAARMTMSGPMDESRYRPVRLPPLTGAVVMSDAARDALEHRIHCQCGCTLDIYTCRTTDFTCPVSPAMHADVLRLVAGGYTEDAILHAFAAVYGEKVLMAPWASGFNWAGYLTPFIALGAGAVGLALLIGRWRRAALTAAAPGAAGRPTGSGSLPADARSAPTEATPDEWARLDATLRRDDP
jgi:cytochrome c-type biogenesis protein CcmH